MAAPKQLRVRMEALERELAELKGMRLLVGGLAHDFNNLLTAISGHASMVEAGSEEGSDSAESATAILKAAEHAAAIVAKLQGMSRRRQTKRVWVDLNEVVSEVTALLRPTTPDGIVIRQELRAKTAGTVADPDQMYQLVLNLALNGRDAMPEGGTLTFETAIDEGGSNVILEVRDTGKGVPEELRERIFEPFFTTRNDDGGTGLGLAVAAGIVKEHTGVIQVRTMPGEGSAFRVSLPLAAQRSRAATVG
ncbi:MAG: hypothetical protein GY953_31260 [bacterium]|nr:hypothetical protein [bacterium]